MEIKDHFELKAPAEMKTPYWNKDKSKYCHFHKDCSHETNECKLLKRALEGLARKGKMNSYLPQVSRKFQKKDNRQGRRKDDESIDEDVVLVISGGFAAGGPTNRGHKNYLRELSQVMLTNQAEYDPFPKIVVSEQDRGKIRTPHDDPLVVEMKIANLRVRRILIDTGSTTDIISADWKAQEKVPQEGRPSILLLSKKRKCLAIKEEKASLEEVMANMGMGLERPQPVERPVEICLNEERPKRMLKIGIVLGSQTKDELITLLKEFEDVFAYTVEEMPGIDLEVAVHKLNIDPGQKPVRQKKRHLGPARNQSVDQEVQKLLKSKFTRETFYPDWIANVVMVPKPNDTWRMCVDYTNLNKACPKDSFPLPIDRLVDSTKCVFGVVAGKFLGFLVDQRGIEANPDKIQAILNMTFPSTIKEVQRLTGCLAALGRFLSKSGDKCHHFFATIKKNAKFEWKEEVEEALQQVKEHLRQLPWLISPAEGERLYVYLAVSPFAVSAVLLAERESVQIPVYFVSHVLKDAEGRYSMIEKFGLALLMASRKLRPYFLAHSILVYTDQPLKQVLHKMDASG
ncbi:uncharacterized protein LOC104907994 [Beta vulgaris subsp. vulgaris]|uniref:uncharacterized protein LOC104907994 n=1 Tax=Beta vulgaris subsp. vulgaris TaxID=3555 RepID=UPI00053FC9BC|nr:uncharacterized protein LOC104907994 [Beta vulgaris subsp. vulgaris]